MSPSSSNSRRSSGLSFSGSSPFLTPFALPVQPILESLSISPASVVLELGEVSCRFTLPIARSIAKKKGTGTVYACDFTEEAVVKAYQKAKDAHITQMVVPLLWETADSGRIPLDANEVEVIIAVSSSVFGTLRNRFVDEALRVLRRGGKLFIADWRDTRKALLRDSSEPVISKAAALDILEASDGATYKELDIPELEWAFLMTKSSPIDPANKRNR